MSFFAAGADAESIADEFDDWGDHIGAKVTSSRLRDSRRPNGDGILILEAVIVLAHDHKLELLDADGKAPTRPQLQAPDPSSSTLRSSPTNDHE